MSTPGKAITVPRLWKMGIAVRRQRRKLPRGNGTSQRRFRSETRPRGCAGSGVRLAETHTQRRIERGPQMTDQTRIAIVDDHPFVREGLKQLLAGQPDFELIAEAASAGDARSAIGHSDPDVAVVDLALGADDGMELVRWIRENHPDVRVLVLSMQEEALYAERLLRLGVSGYVMKNVAGTDFLGALRKVARGQRHVSAAMGERLLSQVARGRTPGRTRIRSRP